MTITIIKTMTTVIMAVMIVIIKICNRMKKYTLGKNRIKSVQIKTIHVCLGAGKVLPRRESCKS